MGAKGFFTDTTLCIGCKACEVACKQWNQLPDDGFEVTGISYDNTRHLGASTWRHVGFVERPVPLGAQITGAGSFSWLMMSDVCKHCARAGCLESCATGAGLHGVFALAVTTLPGGGQSGSLVSMSRSAVSAAAPLGPPVGGSVN